MKRSILSFVILPATMLLYTSCNSSKESHSVKVEKPQAESKASSADNSDQLAYKINGKTTTLKEVEKENPGWNYEIKRREHNKLADMAYQEFLDQFWNNEAKRTKTTPEKAREAYLSKHAKVEDRDLNVALAQVVDHPRFKDLKEDERKKQVHAILLNNAKNKEIQNIIQMALESGDLEIAAAPVEPRYPVKITQNDVVKYGPKDTDTNPVGCSGDECTIKIIEHSEYQCPYCTRVPEIAKKVLANEKLKGKVVWVVRDFPLDFHPRAEPAAIAAHCAGFQDKFWPMYHKLFASNGKLSDKDFASYAKDLKLDMKKFNSCLKSPEKAKALIAQNKKAASKAGITGTPGFIINGRKVTGLLPYEEFMKVINEELKLAEGKANEKKAKL